MNRYRLSRNAESDLENLWLYVATQDELAADATVAKILNTLPMLARFPDMGRNRDELRSGVRSFPSKPYIIFYTKTSDGIEILRIIHQSRDIENIF